jgi:hypothetical protein
VTLIFGEITFPLHPQQLTMYFPRLPPNLEADVILQQKSQAAFKIIVKFKDVHFVSLYVLRCGFPDYDSVSLYLVSKIVKETGASTFSVKYEASSSRILGNLTRHL